MSVDREKLLRIMHQEATEALLASESALVELENNPGDRAALHEVLGHIHTIKGDAVITHLNGVVELAHELETVLEDIDNRGSRLSGDAVSILLSAVDALRDLIARGVAGDHTVRPQQRALMDDFARMTHHDTPAVDARAASASNPARRAPESHGPTDKETLRVAIGKLDQLLDVVGELLIHRGRVRQGLEANGATRRGGATATGLLATHREADHLYQQLQELVMQVRMVSVGPTLRRYARVIRDLCQSQDKRARLSLLGDDVEVDTAIVEHLRAPLTHLVRNAVDHGLESPAVRQQRGKDPVGSIAIHCAHQAGSIVLRVADDGAGIDRTTLLERARALGIIDGADPPPATVDELIFEPRLSTAAVVDNLSGRGMGMDVVRHRVEALRGSITVASEPGQGTEFTIKLPLTMAVLEGFCVGVAGDTFLIPLDAVVECLAMPATATAMVDGRAHGLLDVRGQPLPCVRLHHLFEFAGAPARREHVVVIERDGLRVGLCVDALHGERHTVIKPLGRIFQSVPLVAGGAILASGRVALILDVPALIDAALASAERAVAPGPAADTSIPPPPAEETP